jgi:hypothetical protein
MTPRFFSTLRSRWRPSPDSVKNTFSVKLLQLDAQHIAESVGGLPEVPRWSNLRAFLRKLHGNRV